MVVDKLYDTTLLALLQNGKGKIKEQKRANFKWPVSGPFLPGFETTENKTIHWWLEEGDCDIFFFFLYCSIFQFLEPFCFSATIALISPVDMATKAQIFTGLTLASTPASSFQPSSSSSHSLCMVRKPLTTSFFGRVGMCLLLISFRRLVGSAYIFYLASFLLFIWLSTYTLVGCF